MNFYTQTMIELVGALGAAMIVGNILAVIRRNRDRKMALESLKTSLRTSKQTTTLLAKNQIKQGKATLAVAPLGRSLVFIAIGFVALVWSLASLFS